MDRLSFETPDLTARNIAKIAALFPNVVTEVKDEEKSTPEKTVLKKAINFDLLRQELSGAVTGEGEECYDFTWVGKKASMVEANTSIKKTLRPALEESKNWETTGNLYIEGDNLDVLKLLQESYLGKIKMIYIDPPYNTGNDFIYKDDFAMSREDYDEQIGLNDEEGNRLFQNSESNGRFHSDWCSMIYPRLKLAQNLLTDDGVVFISIADNEVENLKKICNEVFGESGFVGIITWESTTQPDNIGKARFGLQKKIEYILLYSKCNKNNLPPFILKPLNALKKYPHDGKFGKCRFEIIERAFDGAYARPTMQFKILGQYPREGKQWQIGEETARKLEAEGKLEIVDGVVKKAVYPQDEVDDCGYQPFWSHLSSQDAGTSQKGKATLATLFGHAVGFETVKPVELLTNLFQYFPNDFLILDFFSGSATTAHAVMQLNAEDGGSRRFIMVQISEPCDENSGAYKAGYKTICDIGKERIRRAGDKIKAEVEEQNAQLKLDEAPKKTPDIGFRVLKLDSTNMKNVYYSAQEYTQQMLGAFESNIKEDRTDLDLLCGCLLDWGLPLSLPHRMETVEGVRIHIVDETALVACFADKVSEPVVREIAKRRPLRAVFRDSSFANSPDKINVAEIFKLLAPETTVKVI